MESPLGCKGLKEDLQYFTDIIGKTGIQRNVTIGYIAQKMKQNNYRKCFFEYFLLQRNVTIESKII